jgi:transposase
MDNNLCQTSRKSISALNYIEAELHRIPPRSPDLNPIENTFHLIKKKMADEAD